MELNDALEKVRKLAARTVEAGCTPEEAASAQAMADAIMLKFAIDEAMLAATAGAAKAIPEVISILVPNPENLDGYFGSVIRRLAEHTRCQIRMYTKFDYSESQWACKVYGWQSDVRYFEVLYTQIMLHMSGVLAPKWDNNVSFDENCYLLHNAGMNWLQIAQLQGWKKDKHGWPFDDPRSEGNNERWYRLDPDTFELLEEATNWQLGGRRKAAAKRWGKSLGEHQHQVIAAGGTANYRKSAAQGYINELHKRLRRVEEQRPPEGTIMLRTSMEELLDFFKKENPDLFKEREPVSEEPCPRCKAAKTGYCRAHKPRSYKFREINTDAYQRGVRHAQSAPIGREAPGARTAIDA